MFVPKFYYDRNTVNFLRELQFVGEFDTIDKTEFSENPTTFGRKLHEYRTKTGETSTTFIKAKDNNWPFEKNFINESYFLYDKSNLILDTFITTLNKKNSIHGSLSYFQGKTEEEQIILLSAGNFLKFLVKKNTLKDKLKFQLTNISGKKPKTKDKRYTIFR